MSTFTTFLHAGFDSDAQLFACVFQGLDSHRLRVVPVSKSSSVQPQEFVLDRATKVTSLTWCYLPTQEKSQIQKKRKTASGGQLENAEIVIMGTQQGNLVLYSPATSTVLNTLKTGSSSPICGIEVLPKSQKVLTLQRDSTLTEFDLSRASLTASSVVPVTDPTALIQLRELVLSNSAPHTLKNGDLETTFNGFAAPIRQLTALTSTQFAALSEEDRQVFIYEIGQPKPIKSLVCPTTNASHLSCSNDGQILAVSSEDGQVHIFDLSSAPRKVGKRGRAVPQLTPSFSVHLKLAKRGSTLPVAQTFFDANQLVLVWPEQGSVPVFDKISLQTESGELSTENVVLEKEPSAPLAQEHLVGGIDTASAPVYDDHTVHTVSGDHVGELSDDETLADRLDALEVELNKQTSVKPVSSSKTTNDNSKFDQESNSRLRRKDLQLKLSQPGSFATLLNQSLTLNDKQLLEICLEEKDPEMIKTSIMKLEPMLAANLLEQLAATASKSHNRSATFTQWIRWTVVIHGAYLVTLPNLLKTLAGLHSTLSTRASTLPRLLALQGRLQLLEEQVAVRNETAAAQVAAEDDADEPEVYYDEEAEIVNGEEFNDSDLGDENAEEYAADPSLDDEDDVEDDEILLSDEN